MSTRSRPQWMRMTLVALALGFVALLGYARDATTDLQKKYDAIVERLDKAEKDFAKTFEDAKDDDERDALREKRPGEAFIPDFQAFAREAKGNDLAAKAWMKVAGISADFGRKSDAVEAVDTLLADYAKSPSLENLPGLISRNLSRFLGKEKTDASLRILIEQSPHKSVQAPALFSCASTIMSDKKASPERIADARAMMARLQKEFADVKPARGPSYAAMAEGVLFEIDNLQIGKVAPDFETIDENGVKFKLSDYRGKVVVLDFWGMW